MKWKKLEKDKKKKKNIYNERIEERMAEYHDKKPFKKSSKSFKNSMSEVEFIPGTDVRILKQKKQRNQRIR